MFFIEQMDEVITNISGGAYANNRVMLYWTAFLILGPLSTYESLKHISYISITALISIFSALVYVIINDIYEIQHPPEGIQLTWFRLEGIPFYFGTALFMFEGNTVSLEMHT